MLNILEFLWPFLAPGTQSIGRAQFASIVLMDTQEAREGIL